MSVQIFGRRDSRETQKALRFFKERRTTVSFVDITRHPPAAAELRRFSQRFGTAALVDTAGRTYREAGLGYLRLSDDDLFERIVADARLLRLPLVRAGTQLSIGVDEAAWRDWLTGESSG